MLLTTSVGSLPKPDYLVAARSQARKGALGAKELRALEEQATREWIKIQEDLGIDIIVDGEQYRGDMVAYFAEHLGGFRQSELVRSYGNRYYRKPIITGKITRPKPITVEWWRFAQGLTRQPVKGMLTGPYTIMDWSFNDYYPDRKTTCLALAREVRKEVEALLEAGAKIIQIDEPAISARPEELTFAIDAMHVVTDGLSAYFITHICYGAFEFIYPKMLRLPVDNFDLEMSNSRLDLLEIFKEHPFTKDLSFGVVDVHSHALETTDVVKERVSMALSVLPAEQIWLDPDCGLKTRTVEETIGKLRSVIDATRTARGALGVPNVR
jgi:5-methyltetrahydropteroyltriglutamate--homocysteine methyltransferase